MELIRDAIDYALYKSTIYLLTYLLNSRCSSLQNASVDFAVEASRDRSRSGLVALRRTPRLRTIGGEDVTGAVVSRPELVAQLVHDVVHQRQRSMHRRRRTGLRRKDEFLEARDDLAVWNRMHARVHCQHASDYTAQVLQLEHETTNLLIRINYQRYTHGLAAWLSG